MSETTYTYSHYVQSAEALKEKLGGFIPDILLILGSALLGAICGFLYLALTN